jgi:hypothetical protein
VCKRRVPRHYWTGFVFRRRSCRASVRVFRNLLSTYARNAKNADETAAFVLFAQVATRRRDTPAYRGCRYHRAPAAVCSGAFAPAKKLCTDHPQGPALGPKWHKTRGSRPSPGRVIRGTGCWTALVHSMLLLRAGARGQRPRN